MSLNLLLAMAPAIAIVVGLVVLGVNAARRSNGGASSLANRRIAGATLVVALATAVAIGTTRPRPSDIPFTSLLAGTSTSPTFGLFLGAVRLDSVALIGLTTCLGLGLIAVALAIAPENARSSHPAMILFVALLAALLAVSADLSSFAALWAALVLSLVALTQWSAGVASETSSTTTPLGAMTPRGDARRTMRLVLVGAPLFWIISSALAATTGSATFFAVSGAPVGIVLVLILVGAVVAGIAPFDRRRLPHQRRPEIALVVDGVLPVAGVTLAARALGLAGGHRPIVVVVLAVMGLLGIAWAIIASRQGRALGELGRLEGSVALLVLALPTPLAAPASVLVVGIGSLARAARRLPGAPSVPWPRATRFARPAAARARAGDDRPGDLSLLSRAQILDRWISDQVVVVAETLADLARQAEQRYDLAIGLIVALATIFIFYG